MNNKKPFGIYILITLFNILFFLSIIGMWANSNKVLPKKLILPSNETIAKNRLKKLKKIKQEILNTKPKLLRVIKKNIKKALKIKNRKWSEKNIDTLALVLNIGEKIYKINHMDVLSIMKIESGFKIIIHSKTNKNGTRDYGLAQINSSNMKRLYSMSAIILRNNLIHFSSIKNKYDLALNTMSCIIHLGGTRTTMKNRGIYNKKRWIQSYNCGVSGSVSKNKRIVYLRNKYWKKFYRAKNVLLD